MHIEHSFPNTFYIKPTLFRIQNNVDKNLVLAKIKEK